ncbi:hypothetical protein DDB_G0274253 [Dictyostelium discoideum AX4]|uniref:Profilin n=1 Tax=Dictyostelium discoideum TaxID=44689 RepID=Q86KK0_DICDI|nr:hypothetical protein DDB_G0274253 [Dictyostelium discoideum AX4]EAL70019.1 hypothetical protein DDB_G0274253 [Dictyostelium discoideum AX4]|eukprot:XP_644012.1 hypothetical protein DDB_G0274253 [Dictyostelium discoideum AX4]
MSNTETTPTKTKSSSSNNNSISSSSSSNVVSKKQIPSPNVELLEKLAATSIPIALPPSYKPEAKYEKYVNQLVGKFIMSAAMFSKDFSTPKIKNIVLAQKGLLIKVNEAIQIIDGINKGTLHQELISISGSKYIITTVKPRSYYGLNTNLNVGGGIIIVSLEKYILVSLYPASILPTESIPYVENYVINTIL